MTFYTDCRLYLISPPAFTLATFAITLKEVLDAGDVAVFQLRLKDASEEDITQAVRTLMPLCHARDVAFILNDNPQLAAGLGCDGAHIGENDGDVAEARRVLGNDRALGVSCYNSLHTAMEAAENGADYVAFGSFFPTTTKQNTRPAEVETLEKWCNMSVIPACAIGGITPENCDEIIKAGAHFLAVSSSIWQYTEGASRAIKDFNTAIQRVNP